jgi:shikimate kinase
MNIVLIGVRGVGKTNIARRLSFRLKRPVMSSDLLVEYETGTTIADFVATQGWEAFRDREYEVVSKLSHLDDLIIDAGGGVVVDLRDGTEVYSERKVNVLKRHAQIIFLRGDIDRLAAKVADDPRRPTLDARRDAADLMRARLPFYEAAADWTIDVEGQDRGDIATAIAARYGETTE